MLNLKKIKKILVYQYLKKIQINLLYLQRERKGHKDQKVQDMMILMEIQRENIPKKKDLNINIKKSLTHFLYLRKWVFTL